MTATESASLTILGIQRQQEGATENLALGASQAHLKAAPPVQSLQHDSTFDALGMTGGIDIAQVARSDS